MSSQTRGDAMQAAKAIYFLTKMSIQAIGTDTESIKSIIELAIDMTTEQVQHPDIRDKAIEGYRDILNHLPRLIDEQQQLAVKALESHCISCGRDIGEFETVNDGKCIDCQIKSV